MRRVLAALGAALLMALALVGGTAAPAKAEERTPMARFASCLAGGGQGRVLMLLDRSGSLRASDPDSGRLAAAKAVVKQFAYTLEQRPDASLSLAVAGFDATYEKTLDWTPVEQGTVAQIQSHLDGYASSNTGRDTDYWTALDGARREFAAVGAQTSCSLLLWFSDGAYDIEPRASEAEVQALGGPKAWDPDNPLLTRDDVQRAMAAAEADMCRAGGLADQLRSLGVVSIGLGLAVDIDASSFDLMRNFVTGGGGCGDLTEPVPGQFLMSTDVDSLVFDFITVLDPQEPTPTDTPVCEGEVCAEGTRTFVLDGSIGSVAITARIPVDGTRVILQPRVGDQVELSSGGGTTSLDGATLNWEWVSGRVLTVNLVREGQSESWLGPWGIAFVSDEATDEVAKSTITLKGDVTPKLLSEGELRAGADADVELGLVNRAGERVDPATLSEQTRLDVALVTAEGTTTVASGLTRAEIEDPVTLPLTDANPGSAELLLTLDITTQSWSDGTRTVEGTRLEPVSVAVPLTILAPANFPTLPAAVDFGHTESADPVTVQVPIAGEGCVWLAGETTFTGFPDGQSGASLTSPANSADTCATGSLELTLDPAGLGNGSFVGTTQISLRSAEGDAELTTELGVTLSQSRPASQPVLWTTLILVTALGVAIPLGILYLTKYLTAKIPGQGVVGASVTGPVSEHVTFTDQGVPVTPDQLQLVHLTNRRDITVAGQRLRAKMGLALTEPGFVVAETVGPSAGGRGTLHSLDGNAKLPLGVQGNWMVELDPNRPHSGDVRVTIFTAPGSPGMAELLDDVRSNLRSAVARLREGLPPEATPARPDPWGAGSSAPAAPDPWATGGAAPTTTTDPWANPPKADPGQAKPDTW